MSYRRCLTWLLLASLFIGLVGPAAHGLPWLAPSSPAVPHPASSPPTEAPQTAVPAPFPGPVHAALDLWPLLLSLALLLSLMLINQRHAHRQNQTESPAARSRSRRPDGAGGQRDQPNHLVLPGGSNVH